MKLRVWPLIALVLALAAGEARAGEALPLRVVTFNLFHGGPASGLMGDDEDLELRLRLAVAELRALDPDVIGLQEASVGRRRGNVAGRLARELGLQYVFAPATTRVFPWAPLNRLLVWLMNFTEGPAILSRFPITDSAVHELPRCARRLDARVLVRVQVQTPAGPMQVFSTHTSRDECQIRHVSEIVRAERGRLPAIVMADFNAVETAPVMTEMTDDLGFIDLFRAARPEAEGATVWQRPGAPAPTARRRVDYLLLLPGTEFTGRVRSSRVVLDTPLHLPDGSAVWPSDHYGVVADVAIVPGERTARDAATQ